MEKESDRILRSFFQAAPVLLGVVELKEQPRHLTLNPQAASFFKTTEAQAKGKSLTELRVPESVSQQWQQAFKQCLAAQQPVQFHCALEWEGEQRYLHVTVNSIAVEPHLSPRCCYIAQDITELEQVKNHRRLLENAIENADESIVVTEAELALEDGGPKIIYVNQAFTETTGYERNEVLGKTPRILQGPMTDPSVLRRLHESLKETGSFRAETVNYRKDGQRFILEWNIAPLRDQEGNITHWVATQRDVTQRRRLEKQVLEAQGREQERIARDLHDSILPNLNAMSMLASSIRHTLAESGIDPQQLDRLVDYAKQTAEQMRDVSHSLHPIGIEDNGLMAALQLHASTTETLFNICCTFAYEQPVLISDREKATHLYHIAKEAVTNATRHAQAQHILIAFARKANPQICLTIKDDGIGITDAALKSETGVGLSSMRYRAKMIGGTLAIGRDRDGGTIVTCTFDEDTVTKTDSPDS